MTRRRSQALLALFILSCHPVVVAAPVTTPETTPHIVFSDSSVFQGIIEDQGGGNTLNHPQTRTAPITLPAGMWRVLIDYRNQDPHASDSSVYFGLQYAPSASPESVMGFGLLSPVGRYSGILTLTAPFQGQVSLSGGAFGRQEVWFRVVPASDPAFLPFAFGGAPRPLKRGMANAGRGTLSAGGFDHYFLRLPAGSWRVTLQVTAASPSLLPPGVSSGPQGGSYGIAVDLLDQWGVTTKASFLEAGFSAGEAGRQQSQFVLHESAPEFVKLRVRRVGTLSSPNLGYTLSVEPADGPLPSTASP